LNDGWKKFTNSRAAAYSRANSRATDNFQGIDIQLVGAQLRRSFARKSLIVLPVSAWRC
jgi:hypothetical protein